MEQKTHRLVKKPQISARYLADYMAASDQARRTILKKCKYQSIVPLTQHKDAKINIANHLRIAKGDNEDLGGKIELVSRKMVHSNFEAEQLQHNVDYLKRFSRIVDNIILPNAELLPVQKFAAAFINGTKVNFSPDLLVMRTTRTNAIRIGAISFRYAKGKPLNPEVAAFQAAYSFGHLRNTPFAPEADPEHKLCIVLDNYTGTPHQAPGNSIYEYNNMSAACATIADAWDAILPPAKAVF